jgi:hypothetical protein
MAHLQDILVKRKVSGPVLLQVEGEEEICYGEKGEQQMEHHVLHGDCASSKGSNL